MRCCSPSIRRCCRRAKAAAHAGALPRPSFFRYPAATASPTPRLELLHVGNLGLHHLCRRELVEGLLKRQQVPFRHTTTANAEEAARLYAQHALVLNVPLNHDLNHRLFEVMAAGVPQVIFGHPSLLGRSQPTAIVPICLGPAPSTNSKHWCRGCSLTPTN